MNKKVIFEDLGLIDYKRCWEYQEDIFAKTIETKTKNRKNTITIETKNSLIFCEHPHVFTLGKSGKKNQSTNPLSI